MFKRLFLDHPRTVNETYFEHQRAAFFYGSTLLVAGLACIVHGLVPALCTTSGSRRVNKLSHHMGERKRRAAEELVSI
ncbi:DUF6356 family protein [Phenylobacterium montanum]|uniref:Capsule biosynthesis protein n=1 Tax=Phenylobacterium montanum TaxID=2823693 RepID=A0A975G2Q1_9CAUL|nr:DUF6356 family protein [Caulobacter sp. S6]QUD89689.1 hypothetical protein KCG34_07405 [Caulobacter sp. S6]